MSPNDQIAVEIQNLDITFSTDGGDVHAVRDVSLDVRPGEVLAIVGESGSGKTVTARSILGLLPETATARGAVILAGTEVLGLSGEKLREVHKPYITAEESGIVVAAQYWGRRVDPFTWAPAAEVQDDPQTVPRRGQLCCAGVGHELR